MWFSSKFHFFLHLFSYLLCIDLVSIHFVEIENFWCIEFVIQFQYVNDWGIFSIYSIHVSLHHHISHSKWAFRTDHIPISNKAIINSWTPIHQTTAQHFYQMEINAADELKSKKEYSNFVGNVWGIFYGRCICFWIFKFLKYNLLSI